MIITIDGPAGAGKSTAARRLAKRLGFRFLDTGAMYRAVTLLALEAGIELDDEPAVAEIARAMDMSVRDGHVFVDDRDVTADIRRPRVTAAVRYAADNQSVRHILVRLQRDIAADGDFVTEGRDQGSLVFPDAVCKFLLTASADIRAQRRLDDLRTKGVDLTFDEVLDQQQARDDQDASRPFGGLDPGEDTIHVNTDGLTPDEVVDELERIARSRMSHGIDVESGSVGG
jgi:cytidylate kinase